MKRPVQRTLLTMAVLAGAICAGAMAQSKNAPAQSASGDKSEAKTKDKADPRRDDAGKSPKPGRKLQPVDSRLKPEQEAVALAFARAHHPELADLLEKLKQNSAPEFAKAMQDLYRSADRLAKMNDRDAERYPLELDLWKVESRIRLLTAQLLMGGSVSLENDLKGLIVQRIELRTRLLQLDRDRAAQRIATIDRELENLSDPDAAALRELDRLKKNAARAARPGISKGNSAAGDAKQETDKKRRTGAKPESK
jgi:hypothetical protein